jgi:hypothetical protein
MLVDLQDGELVHGENFSLFAAMSALEVSPHHIPCYLIVLHLLFSLYCALWVSRLMMLLFLLNYFVHLVIIMI